MDINKIYCEPCLDTLSRMENESVNCVITSPPYWSLRNYNWNGQWGLEPTYQEYLEHLWQMMDEIYRVLKPDGTCWINLGDTYGGSWGNYGARDGKQRVASVEKIIRPGAMPMDYKPAMAGIMKKCLLLIPHRFAIGCIDRGWILRNDIIWAKRNGMPESVTDRFSKKHEYFFFMVKSEKYFFDLDAIRDPHTQSTVKRFERGYNGNEDRGYISGPQNHMKKYMNNPDAKKEALEKGKNPGSVSDFWDIPTKPSKEKHYASYNDSLLVKPVLAGCPEGGIIYDPFMGTGSTAEVALRSGRKFIGSEGNPEYVDIANKRLEPYLKQLTIFD